MIFPHQLGLMAASKGGAAKPNASCTHRGLDDEPGDSDQAEGLQNGSRQHTARGREDARTECQVVKWGAP
jgi:hypothetical protein